MRKNVLRELLNADKPSLGTHIHSSWPSVVEAVGHSGMFDYIEFVAEYAPYDLYDFDNLCRAAELYDLGTMIKVDQEPRQFVSQRAIGSGFQSVLFADVYTPEEAQQCVNIIKPALPGGGTHGVATRRITYMGYGATKEYADTLNDTVVVLMIEKKSAIDHLEAILDVEGVDMVQFGPADYSLNIGKPGTMRHPETKAVERQMIELCLKKGVHPRGEINSADQAKEYLDLGVRHFCVGTDIAVLFNWFKSEGEAMRKAMEE